MRSLTTESCQIARHLALPMPEEDRIEAFRRVNQKHPNLHLRIFDTLSGDPGLTAIELLARYGEVDPRDFEAYLTSLTEWSPGPGLRSRLRITESEWGRLYHMMQTTAEMAVLAAWTRRDLAVAKIICFLRNHDKFLGLPAIKVGSGLSYTEQGIQKILNQLVARNGLEKRGQGADGRPSARESAYRLGEGLRKLAFDPDYVQFQLAACGKASV